MPGLLAERGNRRIVARMKPNILFIMCDQLRADCIGALSEYEIHTPNIDRLVRRGVSFTQAYSTTPVCVAARYTIRTGGDAPTTRVFSNGIWPPAPGQADTMEQRTGSYLPRVMSSLGYRTFGIGKFHTKPHDEELGYDVHLHTEELGDADLMANDAYAQYIRKHHPEYDHVEQLHGERTEMYYMPQANPLPPELNVESYVADRVVDQLGTDADDGRPYFGFVSFIGPHPPLAPPIPFNRIYDPDRMPEPVVGRIEEDHLDEQIPHMNELIWADEPDPLRIGACRARYFGEITYIDWCLGKILDAVEARDDADNTLIVFYSDHGEGLGDHHAWQKETFFEQSTKVPLLVSWPAKLPANERREELACLTDLFAIVTKAGGQLHEREGHDQLGMLLGETEPRDQIVGWFNAPGELAFKMMVRTGPWKYIHIANGGREQLFHIEQDPWELTNLASTETQVLEEMRRRARQACDRPGAKAALDKNGKLITHAFKRRPVQRIHQMASHLGVKGFPAEPAEVVDAFKPRYRTED